MCARRRRRPFLHLAAALGCASVLGLAGCGSTPSTAASSVRQVAAGHFRGFTVAEPLSKPDVTLTDTSGQAYDIAKRTRGHLVLLYFGYTNCTDTCPDMMAAIAAALRDSPAKIRKATDVLFVTTDPHRDTPQRLRHWLDKFSPHFLGLTGSKTALAKAYRTVGMPQPRVIHDENDGTTHSAALGGGRVPTGAPLPAHGTGYDVVHGADTYAYGTDGKARLAFGPDTTPADYAHDLKLLTEGKEPKPLDVSQLVQTGANGRIGTMRLISAFIPQPARGQDPVIELTLGNAGAKSDTLTAAAASAGGTVRIVNRSGAAVSRLSVGARGTTVLSATGPHLVVTDRDEDLPPLRKGRLVKLTLRFAHAGTGTLTVPVTGPAGPGSSTAGPAR